MSRRAEYRNEVKTRLDDRTYDAVQSYKALHDIESDSAALARIAKSFLFGAVGTLPVNLVDRSAALAQVGTTVDA